MSELDNSFNSEFLNNSEIEQPNLEQNIDTKEEIIEFENSINSEQLTNEKEDQLFLLYEIATMPTGEIQNAMGILPQNIPALKIPSIGEIVQNQKNNLLNFFNKSSHSFITRFLG